MRGQEARAAVGAVTWAGLVLLLAGLISGIFPLLPVTPATGAMTGVPHLPWTAAGLGAAGVILMLWARGSERRDRP
ncbi:MAG TPA: hypothetical protein VGS58_06690 [Candidatus Sulfopaludibacter sp.]|nr:hypothetical protein [Candidatus Sulfopaludibacter sp.]